MSDADGDEAPGTPVEFVSQEYDSAVPVEKLHEHPDNPRQGDLESLGESVKENGFWGAVIAQRSTGAIIVGNHRYRFAMQRGAATLPTFWVDVDDERARRIMLADNRTGDLADTDVSALAALLTSLNETDAGLSGTGYQDDDLTRLIDDLSAREPAPLDEFPEYGEDIETDYACPKCGYSWSGKPK